MKAVEFGIPQKRERVFIIGIRKDLDCEFRFPEALNSIENAVPLSAVIEKLEIPERKYYFQSVRCKVLKMPKIT